VKKAKEDALRIVIAMIGDQKKVKGGDKYEENGESEDSGSEDEMGEHEDCACPCCGEPCAACAEEGEKPRGKSSR
jgi:hypothetical protein